MVVDLVLLDHILDVLLLRAVVVVIGGKYGAYVDDDDDEKNDGTFDVFTGFCVLVK